MSNRVQTPCQHCGAPAEEKSAGAEVFIKCSNTAGYQKEDGTEVPPCGMRTPQFSASVDYGAWDQVTEIWNRSISSSPGSRSNPLPVPQSIYSFGQYYLEDEIVYLCFKEYDSKGGYRPSQLTGHNFAVVPDQ